MNAVASTPRDQAKPRLQQLNMFGPPEEVSSYPDDRLGRHDDQPVPCERELLWPAELVELLGADLIGRLYGDIPKRTRLYTLEVCRRLRCDSQHVYNLRDAGSLDAVDIGSPGTSRGEWRFYRYSLVRFLFGREFRDECTRSQAAVDTLSDDDLRRINRAVETLRKRRSER